jgi:hypothetical protein
MQCRFAKIILSIVLAVSALLCLFGCDNSKQAVDDSTQSVSADDNWTVLVYMCASSLESKSGEASKNISEMLSADIPQNVNLILQTGGTKHWSTDQISPLSTDRYIISNHELTLLERDTKMHNFGESQTLADFVSFGLQSYPSEHTALILWNHGGGTLKGVCLDENFSYDALTLNELDDALKAVNLEKKLDFIGFDACLMASVECASVVSPYAENMIASEEKEPSGGWDYTSIFQSLNSANFYNDVLNSYAQKCGKSNYYTLSCVDLTQIDKIQNMLSQLADKMQAEEERNVISAINSTTSFGVNDDGLFDLGNLFSYFDIQGEYEQYVTCANGDIKSDATGLSVYFPLYDNTFLEDYIKIGSNEKYNSFLTDFFSDDGTIKFVSYAENVDNKLAFTLEPSSMKNFAEAEYELFSFAQDDDNREVPYLLGNDNDITVKKNKITVSFDGNWVEWGGKLLNAAILDDNEDYTTYQAPITVNGDNGRLIFSYDKNTYDTEIVGVTYEEDNYGRINSLNKGDTICVAKCKATDEAYELSYPKENEFTFSDEQVNVVTLPDGYYQYTAFVKDVHGKVYTAGTAVLKITQGSLEVVSISADEVTYPKLD